MLRQREQRHLLTVSRIAEVAQLAVLRNLPPRIGPAQVAVRYVSATAQAHVGGDFYEALHCNGSLRAIVGDVRGKGLEAVQLANVLVGAFRGADHDHVGLAELARTLDQAFLRFEPGDEDFATVVMVELREDGGLTVVNCGHPPAAGRHRRRARADPAAGLRAAGRVAPATRGRGAAGSSRVIACSCTPTASSRAATQGGSSTSMRTHRWSRDGPPDAGARPPSSTAWSASPAGRWTTTSPCCWPHIPRPAGRPRVECLPTGR